MNTPTTELGNEVRREVRAILDKYNGKHEAIAGVKVETIRKIDRLLNPEPETFRIPEERPDEGKFASRKFAAIASCRADEELLFEETGLRTTAGAAEGVGA